jgi:predicted ATPase
LLEDRFPEVTSTQPELVAHHYTEANCPAQAIAYWLKAGVAAARQSANVEAVDQFRRGPALVEALPDECEKAERELDLQMALGPALYATKSYSHPDLGVPAMVPSPSGLQTFTIVRCKTGGLVSWRSTPWQAA